MTELAAIACTAYARAVERRAPAQEIDERRVEARNCLAAMAWLPEGRSHLGLVDSAGNDADLIEICKPLKQHLGQ